MVNRKESSQEIISKSIIKALIYYDIFNYPLTATEIWQNSEQKNSSQELVNELLKKLIEKNLVYKIKEFYLLENTPAYVERRIAGNLLAKEYLVKAQKWSQFIAQFPYVRAVFLSGSLSKNYMGEDGDIDYFIITKSNRLWIARTFLILFKKIFLLNSHKYFCVNYFIDEENLTIAEQNLFTATETVTLIPTCNANLYHQFYEANSWAKEYYPNFPKRGDSTISNKKSGFVKKVIEFLLDNRLGTYLDRFFMNRTIAYWDKKFIHYDRKQYKIALKSNQNTSKHHPNNFQQKVLKAYQEKVDAYEAKYECSLKY